MAGQRILNESTVEAEDRRSPQWRVTTDPPTAWMPVDGNHLMLNGSMPAGYNLYIGYIERPVQMVNDGDLPDARIQEFYHPHICYAAASRLLTQSAGQQDIAKADKFFTQFLALIGAGKAEVAQDPVDK